MTAERTIVKTVENGVLYSDGTILIKNVRASHPHVLVPKGGTDKDGNPIPPAFSCSAFLPKKTHVAVKDLLKARIDELLKEAKIKEMKAEYKFLRNGDAEGTSPEEKGNFTVSSREQTSRPPSVRGADGRTKLTAADDARIFGGCWINILVRPWFQDNKWGKRVNAGLTAVQFLRGDPSTDAFGEGRISEDTIDETFADESGESSGWDSDLADEAADL